MKIRFDQIEARLQAFIESGAARLFSAGSPAPDLGTRLLAEMKANLHPQTDGSIWAPNLYTIAAAPALGQTLQANRPLLDELAHLLWDAGAETDLKFSSYPEVQVALDERLSALEIRILAKYHLDTVVDTVIMENKSKQPAPAQHNTAFLIVNGAEVFPLVAKIINIGRAYDNHLVIEDPRISRYHAQLRSIQGRYLIFDLDSTGGTFVNGQRVRQADLSPGDVITLADIPLIYGQDNENPSTETQEFHPENLD